MRGMRLITSLALAAVTCASTIADAEVHRFTPTSGAPTFAVREPVLRIKPGDIVESQTFSAPGDYYEGRAARGPAKSGRSSSRA